MPFYYFYLHNLYFKTCLLFVYISGLFGKDLRLNGQGWAAQSQAGVLDNIHISGRGSRQHTYIMQGF